MCTIARIDNNVYNVSFTQGVGRLIEDSTNAYVFWMTRDPAKNAGAWAAYLKVRPINKATLALGAEQDAAVNDVVGGEQPNDWASVAVVRLDSGVMIAAMGTNYLGVGNCVDAVESAANDYTTWGARADLDPTVAGRAIGGMSTDGTNCFAYTQDDNTADVYAWKRTAANTWVACTTALTGGKIYDSNGYSATAPWYDIGEPSNTLSSMTNCYQRDASIAFLIAAGGFNSTSKQRIGCLWTTDGWATTNETIIKDYSASANDITNTCMQVHVGTDGRARAMWFENNAAAGRYLPVLAYSDDYGQTWTVVGTPSVISTTPSTFDPTYDGAFCLDSNDRCYLSFFDSSDASNIKHYLYKGGDAISGWELLALCEHIESSITIQNIAGATTGAMFVASNGGLVRVFNGVKAGVFPDPPAFNTVNYLYEAGVEEGGGGAPPLVEESPSGSDQPNIYLLLDIADKRGWSVHYKQGISFAHWPEGDYTTQRRMHEVLFSEAALDSLIVDPANMAAIVKLDDPERWGKETFVDNGDGTVTRYNDPLPFRWWSAEMNLGETGSTNVTRAIYLRYRREGHKPFTVQIWLDSQILHTKSIKASWPDPEEIWFPLPRYANAGSRVQLRVPEDVEDADLIIESFAVKFRPKHWRMRHP